MKEMHIKVKHIFESEKKITFSLDHLKMMFLDKHMMIEHSFDIYAKLYIPTHHFEFYVIFFLLCFGHLFGVMVCSVCHSSLRQTVRPSVCLSVCPSLCEHVSSPITLVLYQMIRNTYCLWLPNFQGHTANFRVTQATKTWWNGSYSGFSGIFWRPHGGTTWNSICCCILTT